MNNNMPNGLNNNLGGNSPLNKVNEDLVQGQSNVGNEGGLMQGIPNATNESNIMQGTPGVQNPNGISQGISLEPENNAVMPGQGHSGINAYTMQYQEPVANEGNSAPEVNNSNNPFLSKMVTDQPVNNLNINEQQVNNNIPNPFEGSVMQGLNQNLGNNIPPVMNEETPENVNQNVNNPLGNNIIAPVINQNLENGNISTTNTLNNNVVNDPLMGANMTNMASPNQQSVVMQGPIDNNINNNQTNSIGNIDQPNMSNSIGGANYNSVGGINPTGVNQVGLSQVGQTEMNHQALSTDIVLDEPKKKKFPLTIRETILVAIALIGIVVVIIMYT